MENNSNQNLFETARLSCRHILAEDLEAMFAVYADPLGARWVDDGNPITRDGCVHWIEVTQRNYANRGYGMFALEDRATGNVIGFCGLVHPGGQEEPEIKYAFLQAYWGKGLASEAVSALLSFGAQAFGLNRVIATVAQENLASQRVLTKSGAKLTHVLTNDDGSRTQVFEWLSPN